MDSFEVENFRSLKHLKLEKLARVNLLVGKNNSGKTSVLEGLFALRSVRSGEWLTGIEAERGLEKEKADFRHLFYYFDSSKIINLSIGYNKEDSSAATPYLKATLSLINNQPSELVVRRGIELTTRRSTASAIKITLTLPGSVTKPVNVNLHRAEDGSMFFSAESKNAENVLDKPLPLSRNYGTEYISTSIDRLLLSQKVETLKVAKQEEQLLRVLRQIDPRIQRIELLSGGQIYLNLEGFSTLMPLNLMGEGFQRLLDVVSAIAQMKYGVVLIDEIDNGLHYSILRILWKGILQAAREYDVQIIATTHSAEALRHLTWVLDEEENASFRDDVAAYTLIRAEDDTVRSYRHDYEQLDYALDHGLEVRN